MNSQLLANAIRMLSVDAIQKANSGHPGAPMGMADIAEVVWRRHLRHNPKNPQWFNRDRYVSSTPARRVIQNMVIRWVLKPPPARWGRA